MTKEAPVFRRMILWQGSHLALVMTGRTELLRLPFPHGIKSAMVFVIGDLLCGLGRGLQEYEQNERAYHDKYHGVDIFSFGIHNPIKANILKKSKANMYG